MLKKFNQEDTIKRIVDDFKYSFLDYNSFKWYHISVVDIYKRLLELEDYLGIHYEEKTTKGYVKNKKK